MSWENALLMKFSNDVEKYEIEVTKMGQNSVPGWLCLMSCPIVCTPSSPPSSPPVVLLQVDLGGSRLMIVSCLDTALSQGKGSGDY